MPLLGSRGSGSARGFGFAGARQRGPYEIEFLIVAGGGGVVALTQVEEVELAVTELLHKLLT
jgi:hypothetical protein